MALNVNIFNVDLNIRNVQEIKKKNGITNDVPDLIIILKQQNIYNCLKYEKIQGMGHLKGLHWQQQTIIKISDTNIILIETDIYC